MSDAVRHPNISLYQFETPVRHVIFHFSPGDRCLRGVSFSCSASTFLCRFMRSLNDIEVCFIKYDTLRVPYCGLFIEIIINALTHSLPMHLTVF